MYQKIDRDNMFDAIWKFPNNLSDAIELGNNINLINDYNNILIPLSIGLVSLLTASTIPYAKARKQFKFPILFGLIVLIITIVLRYLEQVFWLTMWPLALLLYLVYFLL